MKKVLLVSDINFWERSSGHRARLYSLIEFLANKVHLTVVNTGPAPKDIEIMLAKSFKADFFVLEKTKYFSSTGYGRRLKTFLKDKHFDTVIIEYIHSSYFLNFLTEDMQLILDAHDIISNRADGFKKFNYAGALYELSAETEQQILNIYDKVMVLCEPDREKITEMTEEGKAILCPHPVETFSHPIKSKVKNIAFVASAYLPNRDGINWFIANCWPQIVASFDVELHLYGTVCEYVSLQGQQQISCKGFVTDINEIYENADIVINPVRFGAGLKIKNVEALAHGLPLVTTTHGARGIEGGAGKCFLVADDAADFTRAICELIENLPQRKKLSQNARRFIKKNFSPQKCFGPLLEVIGGFSLESEALSSESE